MTEAEILSELSALPDPDYLHAHKIADPLGHGVSYSGATVLKLLRKARADERERCAQACERTGHDDSAEEMALMCARAIRSLKG